MIEGLKIVGIVLIPLMVFIYLFKGVFLKKEEICLQREKQKPSIAFLLPARNEEKVIGGLLKSIKAQSVKIDMKNVFVITQDKKDKTGKVASQYGARVLYRTTNKATKGNALDDGIKQILKKYKFDLYFIFDADNVLDKDYIKNILSSYYAGYDIAAGYRNCKNGNDNIVAGASTLIFSLMNTIINKRRKKKNKNIILSGTGFFIKGKWIDKWQGYPFQTLTEDYEISLYAASRGLKTDYVEEAVFYDEQPTSYKQTIVQRRRWISGYFAATKLYLKQLKHSKNKKGLINVIPIIVILGFILCYAIFQLLLLFANANGILSYVFTILGIVLFIYFVLFFITAYILKKEKNKLNINQGMRIKLLFYHPVFLFGYVQSAISLLFHKNVEWVPIEHKVNMTQES